LHEQVQLRTAELDWEAISRSQELASRLRRPDRACGLSTPSPFSGGRPGSLGAARHRRRQHRGVLSYCPAGARGWGPAPGIGACGGGGGAGAAVCPN
jgi:hypothetical protein